ncbi:MAG: hypothetical protein ACPGQ5_09680 [Alphaproteobacteria bacterium]|jgi:hypothetical protein
MMDLSGMSQVSTLVAEPPRAPAAKPPAEEPRPSGNTSEESSGNQSPEYPAENPEDEVRISKAAEQAADPWVDRTPTEPLVDRSFPLSERAARLNLTI